MSGVTTSQGKVLLLEFVNADQFPGRVDHHMPFIRGYLEQRGVAARWLRFGLSTQNQFEHGQDQVTLAPQDFEILREAVEHELPALVLATDELDAAQAEALRGTSPGLAIQSLALSAFTGLDGEAPFRSRFELDDPDFRPRYDWELANDAAHSPVCDNVQIELEEECGWRRHSLTNNPLYADLDDPRVLQAGGCTFCGNMDEGDKPHYRLLDSCERRGQTPLDWVRRQIRALAADRVQGRLPPYALLLPQFEQRALLRACFKEMNTAGLPADVALHVAVRADQALGFAEVAEELLQDESSRRLGIYAMGIESFDEADLLRFNKGIRPETTLKALKRLSELGQRFGPRLPIQGLSMILFTPWTSLASLQLNLSTLESLGLGAEQVGNLFSARLRLHPGLPITALAEGEGLLLSLDEVEPDDEILRMNRRKLFVRELPWRFREARLEPLARLVMRFDLYRQLEDDPISETLATLVQGWRAEQGTGADPRRLLFQLFQAMVEVAREHAQPLDESTLLTRAGAKLGRRPVTGSGGESAPAEPLVPKDMGSMSSGRDASAVARRRASEEGARQVILVRFRTKAVPPQEIHFRVQVSEPGARAFLRSGGLDLSHGPCTSEAFLRDTSAIMRTAMRLIARPPVHEETGLWKRTVVALLLQTPWKDRLRVGVELAPKA